MPSSPALHSIASYVIRTSKAASSSFRLVICQGSVVDFSYAANPRYSAIVNAANEECLGGGGVDGAITEAGGPRLANDRLALPIVSAGIRCPTGGAVITGPNRYGTLRIPYVIHAVGPNYWNFEGKESEADRLLRSAYKASLEHAKNHRLAAVGFSLLAAGVFRGRRSLYHILNIAVQTIKDFEGYDALQEICLCAFTEAECKELQEIASKSGLLDDFSSSNR